VAQNIPTYSLNSFSNAKHLSRQFQVEVFDANRHFKVSYPHRHDFFEVLFLTKGSGFHVIDSSKYKIEPNTVFFMSPGQAHKIEFSSDIEGYIFIFTSEFYLINKNNNNRLLEFPFFFTINQDNPPLIFSDENDAKFLIQLFTQAIVVTTKSDSPNMELLRSLLDTILNYCASLYKSDEYELSTGKGHLLVKRFFQLVEENYQNNLSVNQYAEKLNITSNHLTQTIRQLTGRTSNDILQSKQILEIKRLLIHTNLTVTQIADQLNFTDQSYFTKFFKKNTGITPHKFRTSYSDS